VYPYVYLSKNFRLPLKFQFKLSDVFPAVGWVTSSLDKKNKVRKRQKQPHNFLNTKPNDQKPTTFNVKKRRKK